jgi:hypothetical protein
MRFDVHITNPPMLISDSVGHGSRRTYAAVARVSQGREFVDVVAVYCHGYYDQHGEAEVILDRLLGLLVVSAPVKMFQRLLLAQFPEELPAGWEDAWDVIEAAVLALPE